MAGRVAGHPPILRFGTTSGNMNFFFQNTLNMGFRLKKKGNMHMDGYDLFGTITMIQKATCICIIKFNEDKKAEVLYMLTVEITYSSDS